MKIFYALFLLLISFSFISCSKDEAIVAPAENTSGNNIINRSNEYIPIILVIYEHDTYGGKRRYYIESEGNMEIGSDFSDKASSAIVIKGPDYDAYKKTYNKEPTVTLWAEAGYSGGNVTLKVGKYTSLNVYNLENKISSVKFFHEAAIASPDDQPDNEMNNIHTIVKLFEHQGLQGHYIIVLGTNNPAHKNINDFQFTIADDKSYMSYMVCPGPNSSSNNGIKLLTTMGSISLFGGTSTEGDFSSLMKIASTESINN